MSPSPHDEGMGRGYGERGSLHRELPCSGCMHCDHEPGSPSPLTLSPLACRAVASARRRVPHGAREKTNFFFSCETRRRWNAALPDQKPIALEGGVPPPPKLDLEHGRPSDVGTVPHPQYPASGSVKFMQL